MWFTEKNYDEFTSFLYEKVMGEWKREILYEERKSNASGFVMICKQLYGRRHLQ